MLILEEEEKKRNSSNAALNYQVSIKHKIFTKQKKVFKHIVWIENNSVITLLNTSVSNYQRLNAS